MKITKNINSKSQKTKKNKTKVIVDILFSNWTKKLKKMKIKFITYYKTKKKISSYNQHKKLSNSFKEFQNSQMKIQVTETNS